MSDTPRTDALWMEVPAGGDIVAELRELAGTLERELEKAQLHALNCGNDLITRNAELATARADAERHARDVRVALEDYHGLLRAVNAAIDADDSDASPTLRGLLAKLHAAVMDKPLALGPFTTGTLFRPPTCISCGKPCTEQWQGRSTSGSGGTETEAWHYPACPAA